MRSDTLRIGFLVIFIALVLCGCVQIDIGDRKQSVSLGDELIDLAKARREGAISDAELDELRKRLLDFAGR